MKTYGKELILDIHKCKFQKVTREEIQDFFDTLCKKIKMKKGTLHFWDYDGYPKAYKKAPAHLKGISSVQFIKTSNITIHTLDDMKSVYLNIFSCKNFDEDDVIKLCLKFFKGKLVTHIVVKRK